MFILQGGEKLELHSLAIVGKSVLLETWMNTVRLPEPLVSHVQLKIVAKN